MSDGIERDIDKVSRHLEDIGSDNHLEPFERIITELRRLQDATRWRNIEEAPADEWVWIYVYEFYYIGRFYTPCGGWIDSDGDPIIDRIEGWIPLPPPPQKDPS